MTFAAPKRKIKEGVPIAEEKWDPLMKAVLAKDTQALHKLLERSEYLFFVNQTMLTRDVVFLQDYYL